MTAPTPEESAKRILAIFSSHHVQSGEILMTSQLNSRFLSGEWRGSDYAVGMTLAVDYGWITLEPTMVRLTEAGFAATLRGIVQTDPVG